MPFPRSSGVLLHPTSLPGRFGIGDLGAEALDFLDLLAAAGQRLWQVLPLGPTGYGDSPYQCFSAFAGNPLLICLDDLIRGRSADGGRTPATRQRLRRRATSTFRACIAHRQALWPRVLDRFDATAPAAIRDRFDASARGTRRGWTTSRCSWRSRRRTAHEAWTAWEPDIAQRDPAAVSAVDGALAPGTSGCTS